MTLMACWQSVWQALGASNPDHSLFHQLTACYSEPHRKYHTMQHLNECFVHLEKLRSIAEYPAEIEIALWFHDAIYETRRTDNEEKSAEWAIDSVKAVGVPGDVAMRVRDLVMVTRHDGIAIGSDAEVLVDIDLAILGAESARFDKYEDQIREEYAWVPQPLYQRERRKVLHQFVSRQTLYHTELFCTLYEAQARANLDRSLARL
jgi:predicted metal-dependent HD superfamily phosphohydrolase